MLFLTKNRVSLWWAINNIFLSVSDPIIALSCYCCNPQWSSRRSVNADKTINSSEINGFHSNARSRNNVQCSVNIYGYRFEWMGEFTIGVLVLLVLFS